MTTELIARARTGDAEAFRALIEPHRLELSAHCYRMLGSFHDAEDTLQDTLLAAWQSFASFEGRASLRTWLYKIATNRCLNALRTTSRRPAKAWDVPGVTPPEPTQLGEVVWLEPFPLGLGDVPRGPDARYEQRESITLTFVTALQLLPHRQLAVLILCDIVGFSSAEVANMLDGTVDSVNSALKRARASLDERRRTQSQVIRTARPDDRELVVRFTRAWEAADVDAIVALLTDDVFIAMPPMAFEYIGTAAAARFFASLFGGGRRFGLVETRANDQPAFGAYVILPSGERRAAGLYALELEGDRISSLVRFEANVLPGFGLGPHV